MWSLDWFSARELAFAGSPIRRVSWPYPKWICRTPGLWHQWTGSAWIVVAQDQFGEEDFRARDWTAEPYGADVCGALPAHNTAPVVRLGWGDTAEMRPVPVPGYPDDIPDPDELE